MWENVFMGDKCISRSQTRRIEEVRSQNTNKPIHAHRLAHRWAALWPQACIACLQELGRESLCAGELGAPEQPFSLCASRSRGAPQGPLQGSTSTAHVALTCCVVLCTCQCLPRLCARARGDPGGSVEEWQELWRPKRLRTAALECLSKREVL